MTDHFDEMAATWEEDRPDRAERAQRAADAICRRIPVRPTWSVVELGSGTGLLARALVDRVGTVTLVDTSPGMTRAAQAKIAAAGRDDLTAVCLDITEDAAPGGPFDLAVSLMALHHVPDTQGFLDAVVSQLRPGGYVAIADLAAEDGSFHRDRDDVHHGFEPHHLDAMAAAAGLVDVHVEEIDQLDTQHDGLTRSYGLLLLSGRAPVVVTSP